MTTPASLPPQEPQAKTGLSGFLVAAALIALLLLAAVYWLGMRKAGQGGAAGSGAPAQTTIEKNEASALSMLHMYSFCLENYAKSNPGSGYPKAIEQLGPAGSGCVDQETTTTIARGDPHSGYVITYVPVPLEGRNAGFQMQARPARHGVDGINSFFLDEPDFYQIRVTAKDRPANDRDPLLN